METPPPRARGARNLLRRRVEDFPSLQDERDLVQRRRCARGPRGRLRGRRRRALKPTPDAGVAANAATTANAAAASTPLTQRGRRPNQGKVVVVLEERKEAAALGLEALLGTAETCGRGHGTSGGRVA